MTAYYRASRTIHVYRSLPEQIQNLFRMLGIYFHQMVQKLRHTKKRRVYIWYLSHTDGQGNTVHMQLRKANSRVGIAYWVQ
jgi:hypothetical protein